MAEYLTRDQVENVTLNSAIPFLDSIPCPNGCVVHQSGSGIFILRGKGNNNFARYEIEFTGNISIPTGGTVEAISLAITLDGVTIPASTMIVTPAAVDEYFNVSRVITALVWSGCCENVSVRNISSQPVQVQNANVVFSRPDLVVLR